MYKGNIIGKNAESKAFSTKKMHYPPLPRNENNCTSINPVSCRALHENPKVFVENMPINARNILNYLLTLKNHYLRGGDKYKYLYMKRATIAKELQLHIDTVQVWINWLRDHGVIGTLYRHAKSSRYFINSIFLDLEVRIALKDKIPALAGVPIKILRTAMIFLSFNGNGLSLPDGFFNGTPSQSNYMYNGVIKTPYRYLSPYEYRRLTPDQKLERKLDRRRKEEVRRHMDQEVTAYGRELKKINREYRKTDQEKVMEAQIPHYLKEIKSLNLTEAGMIRLSMYPESVIRYADEYVSISYAVSKPFEYFAKTCHEETKRRGLRLEYGMVNKLAAKYGVSEKSPSLKNTTINHWYKKDNAQSKAPDKTKSTAYCPQGGRAQTLPLEGNKAAVNTSNSTIQEAIRKQIEARKARAIAQSQPDRSGLEGFAQLVESGIEEWQSEEHKRFGLALVERYRTNEKSDLPFENPLFSVIKESTPQPPSFLGVKMASNLSQDKSFSIQASDTSRTDESFNQGQISFIPEDYVIELNDHGSPREQFSLPYDYDDEWQEVLN